MAWMRSGFLLICFILHLSSAEDAENMKCNVLETVFTTCSCRASGIEAIVDCSSKSLTAVPTISKSYDETIYKLILSNNSITTLSNDSFQELKIENLDLSGNSLADVESGTFLSTKDSLKTLEIDGDSNSMPPTEALTQLHSLKKLTMRFYNVEVIDQQHKFFLPFINLESLTLDKWNTRHIEPSSFTGLDKLKSLHMLNFNLVNLPLEALAQDPFQELETLQISFTSIQSVTHSAFSKLSKLKHLDLSNNKINDLESSCFSDVGDTLKVLNLQRNHLNDADDSKLAGLSGLTTLTQLDLSYNTFKNIPSMPNLGLTNSINLVLSNNEIDMVQGNAFNGYAQFLEKIDLTFNYIRSMDKDSFLGVTQLSSLQLHNQNGVDDKTLKLPISLTNSATTLKTLNLAGQELDPDSLWSVIKELTALTDLNLNSISLNSIPDLTFEKLTKLKQLDLSFNSISVLNQKTFVGLRQLKRLNLKANQIQIVPSCLFHGFHFEDSNLTLFLSNNPIKCDCGIKKLLEDVNNNRISLDQATCIDNTDITSIDPNSLGCGQDQPCIEYYSTTPIPTTPEPITNPPPRVQIGILEPSFNSINVSWTLSDSTDLQKYIILVRDGDKNLHREFIDKSETKYEATSLPEGKSITICIRAEFAGGKSSVITCQDAKTLKKDDIDKTSNAEQNSGSADTGIIVGCVVAGVAFVGVMTAIIILLIFRKKPKKCPDTHMAPTQPRNFAKAELPSMTGDSRMFKKPPRKERNSEKGMQVVAISDGQTSPGARVGRVNMMFQEDGYEPMDNFKKINKDSNYENDHGALPPTPGQDSIPPSYPGGYYNQGFREDKYDQIEVEL